MNSVEARVSEKCIGVSTTCISTLATFLLGVYEQAYFGVGAGWSGEGVGACEAWLRPAQDGAGRGGAALPKEYTNALGASLSDFVATNVTASDSNRTVLTRTFSSGTKVYVGRRASVPCEIHPRTQKPDCRPGHCIFWSNGDVSADNATLCDKNF